MGRARRIEKARRGLVLLLVTDRRAARHPLAEAVRRALRGGVTAVMLREKDLPREDVVALGEGVRDACRRAGAPFLVNHDVEAALRLGADGVHLGFRSVGVVQARAMVGQDVLVGRSTHDAGEIERAVQEGADYVTFGPVYDTPSKRGLLEPRGEEALAEAVRRAAPVPVLALGGVRAECVPALRAAGAAGLAFIGAVLADEKTADEEEAARRLRAAWEAAGR